MGEFFTEPGLLGQRGPLWGAALSKQPGKAVLRPPVPCKVGLLLPALDGTP